MSPGRGPRGEPNSTVSPHQGWHLSRTNQEGGPVARCGPWDPCGGRVTPWLGHCFGPLPRTSSRAEKLVPMLSPWEGANSRRARLHLSYPTRKLNLQKPAPGLPRARSQKVLLWAGECHLLTHHYRHRHRGTCGAVLSHWLGVIQGPHWAM